jgi:hypothetical protein
MVTCSRSIFDKHIAQKKSADEAEAYGEAKITASNRLHIQISLSDAETDATTLSLADTKCVKIHLEREIYGITSNEQKWFKKEFCIPMIQFEAWWETIGIHQLLRTLEQHVINFRYPMMHLVRYISE